MNCDKLPDFFILGVQKAASSSIHKILERDNQFSLPYRKETHFFSENYNKGLSWYLSQYNNSESIIRGEVDPSYIFYKNTPVNIKKFIDNPKFIIVFRKPIDRAYSHYLMSKSRGYEKYSFNEALGLENSRLSDVNNFSYSHHSYLLRGNYSEQIVKYETTFPNSQFLYLKYDDFIYIKKRIGFIKKIYNFLGIDFNQNLNITTHENSASSTKFDFIRDLTNTDNIIKVFLKKLIPTEYLKFKMMNKINEFNRKDINPKKLNYNDIDNRFINWNNNQSNLLFEKSGLNTENWII
jgi:hypothetical protein